MDRQSIVNRAFSSQNITPEAVGRMRNAFRMAGHEAEFDAGLASYLGDRLSDAMKVNASGSMGNVPGKFHGSVWGDQRQQAIVRAALGDNARVQSFERLMEVLRAASRSLPENSPTATDLPAMGTSQAVSGGLRATGKALSGQTYLNLGNELVEGLAALRAPAARQQLAEALLSGDYARQLAQLRMLNPASERALALASQILTGAGVTKTGSTLFPPADREPAAP
jgi:hypothetical protein